MPSVKARKRSPSPLVAWYETHGRHTLPWRVTDDPYAIWISEVMLQQTQVKTVLERYYFPFLERFPTPTALASAPRDGVLKAWEGLGYYNRAINLHEAAKILAREGFPKAAEGWMALPGIGRNTAHAIMAFAYRAPLPILEANAKRVIARLHALPTPKDSELWQLADAFLDRTDPFSHNQAMMDLGATICLPKVPLCHACPLATNCKGRSTPERYPERRSKKAVPVRKRILWMITNEHGEWLVEQRARRHLNGLYGFPQSDACEDSAQLLGNITHTYSHYHLDAEVRLMKLPHGTNRLPFEDSEGTATLHWFTPESLHTLPMSVADRKALNLLTSIIPCST